MRKQTKVVLAAALFTLGASFSAFAAKTGTWNLEDEGWVCYNKDGEEITDEFCLSYGKEYYVGDDGVMVTSSWVDYEDNFYYVGSDGSKTINDWRFVTPEDDEDADEEWFYFDAKGRRVEGKKVINGKTYYFDNEGKMLTGWVEYDANDTKKAYAADDSDNIAELTYCGEDGARLSTTWLETWAPEVDEDEQDEEDMDWYYFTSKGAVQYDKAKDIEGKTYLFGADGKMLTGWVLGTDSDADQKIDSYAEFSGDASTIDVANDEALFYCGTADQGYVKKDRWVKTWAPSVWADADDDNSQYWYHLGKTGAALIPDVNVASAASAVAFIDGETRHLDPTSGYDMTFATIDKKTYAFKSNGQMWSGLVNNDDANEMYYFGGSDDGVMKTSDVMIADEDGYEYEFYFGEKTTLNYKKGVAVTGAAEKSLYDGGLLVKAENAKYEPKDVEIGTTTYYYIVNGNGTIQTSQKQYKEDGVVLINADNYTFQTATKDRTWGSY